MDYRIVTEHGMNYLTMHEAEMLEREAELERHRWCERLVHDLMKMETLHQDDVISNVQAFFNAIKESEAIFKYKLVSGFFADRAVGKSFKQAAARFLGKWSDYFPKCACMHDKRIHHCEVTWSILFPEDNEY